jgi:hypothetical protein
MAAGFKVREKVGREADGGLLAVVVQAFRPGVPGRPKGLHDFRIDSYE